MDLQEFMDRAGVDDAGLAQAIGCDRSTISRIRRRKVKVPDGATMLKLDRWAEEVRRKKRWPLRDRLAWNGVDLKAAS